MPGEQHPGGCCPQCRATDAVYEPQDGDRCCCLAPPEPGPGGPLPAADAARFTSDRPGTWASDEDS